MRTVERLYETFKPHNYNVSFDLSQPDHLFSGQVKITGVADGNAVKLHAKGLVLNEVKLNGQPAEFKPESDDVVVISSDNFTGGDVTVELSFAGQITDAMHGIYPCYFDLDGQKQELLATQFESHHAREAFPCIDEPEAKATFDVELVTGADLSVLGNMPIAERQTLDDGRWKTKFETTPVMSSYLLAFVVGDLQSKTAKTKDGVEVTTWSTKAQPANSLDFSLDVAVRSIEFFNDYFGVKYPLPKCDHVALPDFSSGAMENWGLITYREICLLADKNTAIGMRQYIATVIAHETSHQWFGNLVTMRWWDDLWLNESFATLMEYVCVDALFPDWNIWLTFASQEVLMALRRDYLPGVQAVKCEVHHPDEISTLFDSAIVYAKGARLMVMARAYVGDQAFRDGLSDYFRKHQYKNTAGSDLWQALGEASRKDVAAFMTPWLEQSGYPKIKLELDGDQLNISQQQFLIPAQASDKLWPIPLNGRPKSLPALLDGPAASCRVENEVVLVNQQAASHTVVQYDQALLDRLIGKLADLDIDPVDRLSLLHDTSLLARAGDQTAVQLLDLLLAYRRETDEPVWDIISLAIADLKRLIEGNEPAEAAMKQQVAGLAQPAYQRLGWQAKAGESDNDAKLRPIVAGLLAWADDQSVIDEGLKSFDTAGNLADLNGEMRSVIFAIATKHGDQKQIERLFETHQSTANSELQNDIVAGLTATHNPGLAQRLVDGLKDEKFVRPQDVFRWFAYLIRNRYSRELTWQWLTDNWDWIEKTFGGDKSYDDFAKLSAAGLSNREWLDRYRDFWQPKRDIPSLKRAIELGIKDIEVRADWVERDSRALIDRLTNS